MHSHVKGLYLPTADVDTAADDDAAPGSVLSVASRWLLLALVNLVWLPLLTVAPESWVVTRATQQRLAMQRGDQTTLVVAWLLAHVRYGGRVPALRFATLAAAQESLLQDNPATLRALCAQSNGALAFVLRAGPWLLLIGPRTALRRASALLLQWEDQQEKDDGDASEGFRVDVEGCKRAVLENDAKLLFLTSPNNPDGSVMRDDDLDELLKLPCLVVLDEAYVEFSGTSASRIAEVATRENLIVLRTFSKRAALAGMRVGYGAFPRGIIEYMWRAKQPYNVSVAAEVAACAALSNPEYLEDVKTKLVNERARLRETLDACPFLTPYDSHANFILCRVDGDRDALEVKNALAERGIMVRHYVKPASISGCIRISVGKPEQTDALKEALDAM